DECEVRLGDQPAHRRTCRHGGPPRELVAEVGQGRARERLGGLVPALGRATTLGVRAGEVGGGLLLLEVAQAQQPGEREPAAHELVPIRATGSASSAQECCGSARSSMAWRRNASIASPCVTAASTLGLLPETYAPTSSRSCA